MIKVIEIDAPLEILKNLETSGLSCQWNDAILSVTLNADNTDDLIKFATILSSAKKVTLHCTRMIFVEGDKQIEVTGKDLQGLSKEMPLCYFSAGSYCKNTKRTPKGDLPCKEDFDDCRYRVRNTRIKYAKNIKAEGQAQT